MNNSEQINTRTKILKMVAELTRWEAEIEKVKGEDSEQLMNLNLISDLNLDSIQLLDFLMQIEEDFGVQLDSDDIDLDEMMKVGNLVAFVCKESETQSEPS